MIVHYHYQWNKWDEVHRNREAAAEHVGIIRAILDGQDRTAEVLLDQHLTRSYGTLLASVRWNEAASPAA
jgi:DNA-binding GntR family transcriptional regulator